MSSLRRRSLHPRSAVRIVAVISVLGVLAACTGQVAGSAVGPAVAPGTATSTAAAPVTATGTATETASPGGITEPSVLPGQSRTTSPGGGASTSSGGTAGPAVGAPAGLATFYLQRLAWGPCAGYALDANDAATYASTTLQCARLTVPLAYADPTGPTIKVGVLRKLATDPAARIGSLVMDPGGPGGSGMSFVASLVVAPGGTPASQTRNVITLNTRFDLVGIDPRGIGSSLPAVSCQTDAERDQARTFDVRSRNRADVAAANTRTAERVAECVANTGKAEGIDGKTFLANVGTRDVVRDLDILRAVLGDARLTYAGFSYGTEIGWEYAEQFPGKVRALLFDGDINPNEGPAAVDLGQQKSFQAAFNAFAAWCAQNSRGCALGTDTSKSLSVYEGLVRPLLTRPLPLSDGRAMSFTDASTGTTLALYAPDFREILAVALLALSQGKGEALMALADYYDGRDQRGHYSNESEAFDAVRCVDAPSITDPAQATAHQAEIAAAAPFLATGDPPGAVLDTCALWPVPPTLRPHVLKISGLPKTLVISTTGDPATPYANGVELAREIGATLLTVRGVRHTSYLSSGVGCVDNIGNAYLLTLALPKAGTVC